MLVRRNLQGGQVQARMQDLSVESSKPLVGQIDQRDVLRDGEDDAEHGLLYIIELNINAQGSSRL